IYSLLMTNPASRPPRITRAPLMRPIRSLHGRPESGASMHQVTVIAAERVARAIVRVRPCEVVRRPAKQPRHAGHDQLAHVRGPCLLVGLAQVAVDRVSHLSVHRSAVLL